MAVRVDHHVGEQRHVCGPQELLHVSGVQHLDGDVLHARAVFFEVRVDRLVAGADEHDGDTAAFGDDDARVVSGRRGEPDRREKLRGCVEVRNGDHDVVDAARDRVERRREHVGHFRRLFVLLVVRHFDAVRFGEQDSKELLGKIGIDVVVDRPLPARGEHLAHALRLNDRGVRLRLQSRDLATHFHALGEQLDDRGVDVVDLFAEFVEVAHARRPNILRSVEPMPLAWLPPRALTRRSTCLASTSNSMFTLSPARRAPSVVTLAVWGMTAT